MSRRIDENGLRDALHSALDGLPIKDVPFERIAATRRRRRSYAVTAAATAVLAVTVGVATMGLPPARGLPASESDSIQVGGGQAAPSGSRPASGASPDARWSSTASPGGPDPTTPSPAESPATGGFLVTPGQSVAPPVRPSATPTSPAGYCPVHEANGRITYPTALDPLTADSKAWNSPADGVPVPFTPNRTIICRYASGTGLAGAADVTDATTVAQLRTGVNSASVQWDNQDCPGEFSSAYIIFTTGTQGQSFNVDITDCFGWMQPSNYLLPAEFARQVKALTPAGRGR